MSIRTKAALSALAWILTTASPARAQPKHDPAAAEALFGSGKELLKQGDWPGACAKFRASMELDPSPSTMLKIARCDEHEGKLARAWSDTQEALKLTRELISVETRRKEIEAYALKLLASLDPRVPRLRIRAPERPAGLALGYDGRPLPVEALGEPLPVDPGEHRIDAEAPGYVAFHQTVTLAEGQKVDVDIALVPSPAPPAPILAPTPSVASPGPRAARVPVTLAGSTSRGAAQRAVGLVVAGLGVTGLGVAAALGLWTLSKVGDAAPYCDSAYTRCRTEGMAILDDARGLQTAALALAGVATAVVAGGIALYATAPKAPRRAGQAAASVDVALAPAGLSARVRW